MAKNTLPTNPLVRIAQAMVFFVFGYGFMLSLATLFQLGLIGSLAPAVSWFGSSAAFTWFAPLFAQLFTQLGGPAFVSILVLSFVVAGSFWLSMYAISGAVMPVTTADEMRWPWQLSAAKEWEMWREKGYMKDTKKPIIFENATYFSILQYQLLPVNQFRLQVLVLFNPLLVLRLITKSIAYKLEPNDKQPIELDVRESRFVELDDENLNSGDEGNNTNSSISEKSDDGLSIAAKLWRTIVNLFDRLIDIPLKGLSILFWPVSVLLMVAAVLTVLAVVVIYMGVLFIGSKIKAAREINFEDLGKHGYLKSDAIVTKNQVVAIKGGSTVKEKYKFLERTEQEELLSVEQQEVKAKASQELDDLEQLVRNKILSTRQKSLQLGHVEVYCKALGGDKYEVKWYHPSDKERQHLLTETVEIVEETINSTPIGVRKLLELEPQANKNTSSYQICQFVGCMAITRQGNTHQGPFWHGLQINDSSQKEIIGLKKYRDPVSGMNYLQVRCNSTKTTQHRTVSYEFEELFVYGKNESPTAVGNNHQVRDGVPNPQKPNGYRVYTPLNVDKVDLLLPKFK